MIRIVHTDKYRVINSVIILILLGVFGIGCADSHNAAQQTALVSRDLEEIQYTDTLRVITRNHPLTYYLYRGTRRGFDYELIQKFAEEQNLFLEIVIPPSFNDMIPYLYEGRGDVIASNLAITPEREQQILFTHPYLEVRQVTVGTVENPPPQSIGDLEDRWVFVRNGTSYEERLREMQANGIDLRIETLEGPLSEMDPIELVANGERDLTVVDNTIAMLEQQFFPNLEIGVPVSDPQQLAWAVRPNSPELAEALNEFIDRYYRSAFFNILKARYFERPDRFRVHRSAQYALRTEGRISRYDDYFQAAANETGFDWRLLAAVSYHESRFSPQLRSWAGAYGLMQLMPKTAELVGIDNRRDPEQNILGGGRYLRILYNQYSYVDTEEDRLAFMLAAYNAGRGHLADAMQLAEDRGLNPHSWDDVAEILPLFEDPDVNQHYERGYFRGRSVRNYVYTVLHRYDIFRDMVDEFTPDFEEPFVNTMNFDNEYQGFPL